MQGFVARLFVALTSLCLVVAALSSCEPPRPTQTGFGTGTHRGPPKPGSSITHTKMCECRSCEERSCCEGDLGNRDANEKTCEDYDFTKEGCGLSVKSCTGRCSKHV